MDGPHQLPKWQSCQKYCTSFESYPSSISLFKNPATSCAQLCLGSKILYEGLGLPNITKYYQASHLAQLPKYHATQEIPLWVALESVECDPLSVANLLWLHPRDRRALNNPITCHSLVIWDRLKNRYGFQSPHNPLLSYLRNPAFYPAWTSLPSFHRWSSANLIRAHKCTTPNEFKSFPTLCESHDIPNSEKFSYLQIKHFFASCLRKDTSLPTMSTF